jgi:hypothetical protein
VLYEAGIECLLEKYVFDETRGMNLLEYKSDGLNAIEDLAL